MSEWTQWDSLGIIVVLGMILGAAGAVDGIAQALIVLVGVVIVFLWIGNFVLQGYTDIMREQRPDH